MPPCGARFCCSPWFWPTSRWLSQGMSATQLVRQSSFPLRVSPVQSYPSQAPPSRSDSTGQHLHARPPSTVVCTHAPWGAQTQPSCAVSDGTWVAVCPSSDPVVCVALPVCRLPHLPEGWLFVALLLHTGLLEHCRARSSPQSLTQNSFGVLMAHPGLRFRDKRVARGP